MKLSPIEARVQIPPHWPFNGSCCPKRWPDIKLEAQVTKFVHGKVSRPG